MNVCASASDCLRCNCICCCVPQGVRNVFTKVQAVNGDLSLPQMGMSDDDTAAVLQDVTTVIHCAAHIELDAAIHKTLK